MLKWLLTILLVVIVLGAFTPWLDKLVYRRLPGDIDVKHSGQRFSFPVVSTIVLSLLASLIFWLLS